MKLLEELRRRTRTQWREQLQETTRNARIWVQEHGESALFIGIAVGVVTIVFARLIAIIVVVAGALGLVTWFLAPKDGESPAPKEGDLPPQ